MEWQYQLVWAWFFTASAINYLFAVLCVLGAFGLPVRWVAVLSAVLYVALALV